MIGKLFVCFGIFALLLLITKKLFLRILWNKIAIKFYCKNCINVFSKDPKFNLIFKSIFCKHCISVHFWGWLLEPTIDTNKAANYFEACYNFSVLFLSNCRYFLVVSNPKNNFDIHSPSREIWRGSTQLLVWTLLAVFLLFRDYSIQTYVNIIYNTHI